MNNKIKLFILAIIGIWTTINGNAQVPEQISYQAVIRDADGNPLTNQEITLKVNFISGNSSALYYSEEHTAQTTAQGIALLKLGGGTAVSGNFSDIDWASGNILLKMELEQNQSWIDLGSTQLLSVPFAFYAASGNGGENGISIDWLGSFAEQPSNPALNQAFYSSTDKCAYIWNGNSWQPMVFDGSQGPQGEQGLPGENGISIDWLGSFAEQPSNPTLNQAFYSSTGKCAYIWNGNSWQSMTFDGSQGPQGEQGLPGENGISIDWLGTLTTPPSSPLLNQAYYNSTLKVSYIWNGSSWKVIAHDGSLGPQGPIGPEGPQGPAGTGLNNKGDWVSGTTYDPGDYVFAENSSQTGNSMWIVQSEIAFASTTEPRLDASNWVEFEAPAGPQGEKGISIEWLGTYPAAPSSPTTNQGYYNSIDKKSYIWDGDSWEILSQDGEQGPAGILVEGTTGQTLRHNGTSWVASSTLYNNDTNIGININTPTQKLDVNGNLRLRGFLYDYNNTEGTAGQLLSKGTNGVVWQSPTWLTGSGTSGNMAIWNGTSSITDLPNLSFANSLSVQGNPTTNPDDPIFEVKNSKGDVIFGVYQEGVRINISDDAITKGAKRGFAVGGLTNQTKTGPIEYLRITPDSARVYVKQNPSSPGAKGGFAVEGLIDQTKTVISQNMFFIAPDSARIYVNNSQKGAKRGFAVGGLTNATKGTVDNFLNLTPDNYFIGHKSGTKSTGLYNSTVGYQSGMGLTSGSYNVLMGYNSGLNNSEGNSNIFIGYETGKNNIDGSQNIAIGKNAAFTNTSGDNNIVIGENAGYSLTTGNHNTLIGSGAGYSHTNQEFNVMIGTAAGYRINASGWNGSFNTFVGINTGFKIKNSKENVFLGTNAGYMLEEGNSNTIVGIDAGRGGGDDPNNYHSYTTYRNTMLGCQAGRNLLTGNNNVFIGYQAGYSESNVSNKLYIANSSINPPLIYGDFSSIKLGINTTTLTSTLNVGGDITTSGSINATTVNANVTGNVTGDVTGNVTGDITGKVNNITMTSFTLSVNGEVVSIPSLDFKLTYSVDDRMITLLNNNSTQNCNYRIVRQTTSGLTPTIDVVLALDKIMLMEFAHDGEGCELHFCDEDETANCSVWLTYIHGKIIGHYVMF
ncbi:MAG TPA: hypothetical protein PLA24_07050 [Tenuifilaceae bacterium]|nr:hypothetical protein [Tenuifilaceae bacterium]